MSNPATRCSTSQLNSQVLDGVPTVGRIKRTLDWLMIPIMWLVSGFDRGSIQETHFWHSWPVDPNRVDSETGVLILGNDESKATSGLWPLPIFHIPILGGWKNYVVLEVHHSHTDAWHVGWIYKQVPPGFRIRNHLQSLPIFDRQIRVLTMPVGCKTIFFAVDSDGKQLPLREVARGKLGDGKNDNVRLF